MLTKLRPHLTYANVVSTLCLFFVMAGGAAYAADTIFSSDIVDGEVKTPDIAQNAVATGKIGNNQVFPADVRDDTLPDGGLTAADLAQNAVGTSELQGARTFDSSRRTSPRSVRSSGFARLVSGSSEAARESRLSAATMSARAVARRPAAASRPAARIASSASSSPTGASSARQR